MEPAAVPNCAIERAIPIPVADMLKRSLKIRFPKCMKSPAPKPTVAVDTK